jgi:hypothetical protein
MLQVALAGSQPLGDLVEAARPVDRTHGDKLAPAGEAARMALGSTLFTAISNSARRNKR